MCHTKFVIIRSVKPQLFSEEEWKKLHQALLWAQSGWPGDDFRLALNYREAVTRVAQAAIDLDAAAPYYLGWTDRKPVRLASDCFGVGLPMSPVRYVKDFIQSLPRDRAGVPEGTWYEHLLFALRMYVEIAARLNEEVRGCQFYEVALSIICDLGYYFRESKYEAEEHYESLEGAVGFFKETDIRVRETFLVIERYIRDDPRYFERVAPLEQMPVHRRGGAFVLAWDRMEALRKEHAQFCRDLQSLTAFFSDWERNGKGDTGWTQLTLYREKFGAFFAQGKLDGLGAAGDLPSIWMFPIIYAELEKAVAETRAAWQGFLGAVAAAAGEGEVATAFRTAASALYGTAEKFWLGRDPSSALFSRAFAAFDSGCTVVSRHLRGWAEKDEIAALRKDVAGMDAPPPVSPPAQPAAAPVAATRRSPAPAVLSKTGSRLGEHKILCDWIILALENLLWDLKQSFIRHKTFKRVPKAHPPSAQKIADDINERILGLAREERKGGRLGDWLPRTEADGREIRPITPRIVRRALENAMNVRLGEIISQNKVSRDIVVRKYLARSAGGSAECGVPSAERGERCGVRRDSGECEVRGGEFGNFGRIAAKDDDIANGGHGEREARQSRIAPKSRSHLARKEQMANVPSAYRNAKISELYFRFFSIEGVLGTKKQGCGDGNIDIEKVAREIVERTLKRYASPRPGKA